MRAAAFRPAAARCSPACDREHRVHGQADLPPVADGLFQVPARDLVQLDEIDSVPDEPVGEALVELRPLLFRQGFVGGVADEQVPEAECVLTGKGCRLRADQLLAHECRKLRPDPFPQLVRRELADGATVEDLALHGAALDYGAFLAG